MSEHRDVNVGLIGHRFMGKAHTHAYTSVTVFFDPTLRPVKQLLCARSDDLPEVAERWGWKGWEHDWQEVVTHPDIDLVDVCAPSLLHKDIVLEAAAAGKHVFCEKPLAMNLEDAREMLDAVERAGVVHTIGFNYRKVPAIALAKQLIDNGEIGRIFHFRGLYSQDWLVDPNFPLAWRLRKVVDVGEGVNQDLLGLRAAVVPLIPCWKCSACQRQLYSACNDYSFVGSRRPGSFAQYMVVPTESLVELPADVEFEIGAILEPATVALHALERAGMRPGKRVAVLGAGSVGLCAVQWARIQGASFIACTDVVSDNLEIAKSSGAHATLNPRHDDVVTEIETRTTDGVDIAIEAAGHPQALEQAIMMTRPRGVVICAGNQPRDASIPTSLVERVIRQELDVRGTWMSHSAPFPGHEWTDTIAATLRGDLDLGQLISHRFPLSAVPQIFHEMHADAFAYQKIIVAA